MEKLEEEVRDVVKNCGLLVVHRSRGVGKGVSAMYLLAEMLKRREVEAACEPGRRLDIFAVESLLGRLSDLKRLVKYCLWNALFRHDLSQGADGT